MLKIKSQILHPTLMIMSGSHTSFFWNILSLSGPAPCHAPKMSAMLQRLFQGTISLFPVNIFPAISFFNIKILGDEKGFIKEIKNNWEN